MGSLAIMDVNAGDIKQSWDPDDPDEVRTAREAFDSAISRGMRAYEVNDLGTKGH